jgi:hypothetical protein
MSEQTSGVMFSSRLEFSERLFAKSSRLFRTKIDYCKKGIGDLETKISTEFRE